MKKIAMGNDHSAVEMKEAIKAYVEQKGYEVIDFGTNSSESCGQKKEVQPKAKGIR